MTLTPAELAAAFREVKEALSLGWQYSLVTLRDPDERITEAVATLRQIAESWPHDGGIGWPVVGPILTGKERRAILEVLK